MCMEDIRIGRKIAVTETRLQLTNVSQLIVQADPKRVLLKFWTLAAGTFWTSIRDPAVANQCIGNFGSFDFPVMTVQHYGQAVIKAWYGLDSSGGNEFVTIFEGHLEIE